MSNERLLWSRTASNPRFHVEARGKDGIASKLVMGVFDTRGHKPDGISFFCKPSDFTPRTSQYTYINPPNPQANHHIIHYQSNLIIYLAKPTNLGHKS
jgi:hypothetical protein